MATHELESIDFPKIYNHFTTITGVRSRIMFMLTTLDVSVFTATLGCLEITDAESKRYLNPIRGVPECHQLDVGQDRCWVGPRTPSSTGRSSAT